MNVLKQQQIKNIVVIIYINDGINNKEYKEAEHRLIINVVVIICFVTMLIHSFRVIKEGVTMWIGINVFCKNINNV